MKAELAVSTETGAVDKIALVEEFFAACEALHADELGAYFTDDALYHNVPLPKIRGRRNIEKALGGTLKRLHGFEIEVLHVATTGNAVLTERVDTITLGRARIAIPIMGVFEIREGKFSAWRDYFDLATVVRAAGREGIHQIAALAGRWVAV